MLYKNEEEYYTAKCLENNISSKGKDIEETLESMGIALSLYEDNILDEELTSSNSGETRRLIHESGKKAIMDYRVQQRAG